MKMRLSFLLLPATRLPVAQATPPGEAESGGALGEPVAGWCDSSRMRSGFHVGM